MQVFDSEFGAAVKSRFGTVAEDATPEWGEMTRDQVQGHLNKVLLYTLGEGPELPFRGSFKTRYIFRHVILLGLKDIPHNIKVPRPQGVSKDALFSPVDLETLSTTVDRYVEGVSQGGLPTRIHPYFGPLPAAQWQRFHRLHFIHHMKQFGISGGL